jgi:hypothetical protein
VNYTKNLLSIRPRSVEHAHTFEVRHPKDSQRCQTRHLEPAMPSHLRLCGKERERFVCGEEKLVTNPRAGLRGKIIGLVVEVLIRLRADDVAGTHLVPVLLRRSSNWRCLASQ